MRSRKQRVARILASETETAASKKKKKRVFGEGRTAKVRADRRPRGRFMGGGVIDRAEGGPVDDAFETAARRQRSAVMPEGGRREGLLTAYPERLAEGFGQSLTSAATLPGDVVQGNVDPQSNEGINRALGLAGWMVGTPGGAGGLGSGTRYKPPRHNQLDWRKMNDLESSAYAGAPDNALIAETKRSQLIFDPATGRTSVMSSNTGAQRDFERGRGQTSVVGPQYGLDAKGNLTDPIDLAPAKAWEAEKRNRNIKVWKELAEDPKTVNMVQQALGSALDSGRVSEATLRLAKQGDPRARKEISQIVAKMLRN